jgi:hypothetical protein
MPESEHGVEPLIQFARANPTALGQLLERYRSFLVLMAEESWM